MRATDFLIEAPADEIAADLRQIGFTDQRRDSSKTISVYVPPAERLEVMQQMTEKLPDSFWDKDFSNSSIGAIRYKGGTIRVRPKGKAGGQSAGLGNEQSFIDAVNGVVEAAGEPVDINFIGSNGVTWSVKGVQSARGVGSDTGGRKKADVVLATANGAKGVSLKKGNAEYWESADTYFGKEADEIIGKLVAKGKLELIPLGKNNTAGKEFMKLSREIAVRATPQETIDIVFGSDLQGQNGAILKQTFTRDDFVMNGNQVTVNCKIVIVDVPDVPEDMEVFFLIRNDSSRGRPKYKYPGVRSTAVYKKRLNGPTLVINRQ
mgnify:CR=1 FL=1